MCITHNVAGAPGYESGALNPNYWRLSGQCRPHCAILRSAEVAQAPIRLRREPQRTDPDLRGASVFERDILNENFDDIRDGASLVASVFL